MPKVKDNRGITWKRTMLSIHGSSEGISNHMRVIGSIGGSTPTDKPKGFKAHPELASAAGTIGGMHRKRNITNQYQRKLNAAYKHLLKVQEEARKARGV